MTTKFVGVQFQIQDPWGRQDHYIVKFVCEQIKSRFEDQKNLIILTTWFGPQFDKLDPWRQVQDLIDQNEIFDNLFWVSPVDPLCVLEDEMQGIEQALKAKNIYRIGTGFNSRYEFNTGAICCLDDFPDYNRSDLLPKNFDWIYICYNRKPKPHRINLVNHLLDANLQDRGIITLGEPVSHYDVTEGADYRGAIKIHDPQDYTRNGFYNLFTDFGGVPYDLTSLGRLDLWQSHFLNVVSETEFREWDNRFVTEKTWKPIIGLRPFVINGQVKIYQWLRDNGFRTFNHYWPVDIENSFDEQVQPAIVNVIKYLVLLDHSQLQQQYQQMLPDLEHNRHRFFEFAHEQKNKMRNLFK